MAHFFFPFGVRLSTCVCLAAFLVLAGMRRDWRPLLACGAWLWGFEFTFQLASIAAGHHEVTPTQRLGYILLAPPIVLFASNWVRPDPRIFAAALITFGIWLSTGFHVNTTLIHFNVLGEVLNELSKTLWAVAYLNGRKMVSVPLAKTGDSERRQIIAEYALVARNEKSSGGVFDNTTS